MCGRYAASANPEDLVEEFEVDQVRTDEAALRPSWNVAPTQTVPVVLTRVPRPDEEAASPEPVRQLRAVRWGLVPSWARDVAIGSRLVNARMETAADKPAFRAALARRRCLVPADGYYEWYTPQEASDGPGGRKVRKQPFFIHRGDGARLALAGLYELWHAPDAEADEGWLWTMTVLTTQASDDVGRIHDRMPLLVPARDYAAWLDPAQTDGRAALGLLVPAAPGLLDATAVSDRVNNVRNDGPELVRPLPPEGGPAELGGDGGGRLF